MKKTGTIHEETDGAGDENSVNSRSIFVKNLNFSTGDEAVKRVFQRAGAVRAVNIPLKQASGSKTSASSAGFCFVEFEETPAVEVALRELQGVIVDGHALEVSRQNPRLPQTSQPKKPKASSSTPQNTKLLVRNVAFQASAGELRELFANFGSLKSLRMPKKMDGQHRGFAFVEFQSAHEAAEAMLRLKSSHLYGRHLVIEWGDDGNAGGKVSEIRSNAKRDASLQAATQQTRKRQKGGEDEFSEFFGDDPASAFDDAD